MKIRIQFTPALTAALSCATGWFAFWMFAFRPGLPPPVITAEHPEVIRLIADDETLRKLKAPTLFALPSDEGFSGQFLENRVDLHLSLEKPASPVHYLPREDTAEPGVDRMLLTAKTVIPQSALPVPGAAPQPAAGPAAGTQLFLPPELELLAGSGLQPGSAASGLPETVCVNLTVRTDGTVEHVFFETPVTNAALLSAIRQLRFKPPKERTESRIDIRFVQEEEK